MLNQVTDYMNIYHLISAAIEKAMDLSKAFDTISMNFKLLSYMHMVLLKSHLQLFLTTFLTVGNMLKLILLSVLGQN